MENEKTKKGNKLLSFVKATILIILLAICATTIYFNTTHEMFIVYGPSMAPTLNNAACGENDTIDSVFVSKVKSYTRGDIIVANRNYGIEGQEAKYVIKRLIAVGGDKIKIETIDGYNRIVIIKGGETEQTVLDEPYLVDYSVNSTLKIGFDFLVNEYHIILDENQFYEIPQNHVFYMGDNRTNSRDCLSYGPKSVDVIVGKVDYIIYGGNNAFGQVIGQFFGW